MNAATEIPLVLCYAAADARQIDAAAVKALAASIGEVGLLNPVSVRRAIKVRAGQDADAYEVLAGMHRVKAFRLLGRETIPAFVFDADDLLAELILIDENLCRKDLSPAERAGHVTKRKRIYLALHPETAHGAIGGGHDQSRQIGDSEKADRFTQATAEKTGKSERSIQRESARGEALGEDTLAKVARTSLDQGAELDALAKLSPEKRDVLIERAVAGEKVSAKTEAKKNAREGREIALAERQAALPDKRFGVILADPEWQFEPWSRKTGLDRAADNHYPTSATEVIASRPVGTIAANDCVLFLWATAPMLPQALLVMGAWGFDYKTHIIWRKAERCDAKPVLGTGYWFRNGHELLLVGSRGSVPAPAPGTQWPSLFDSRPRKHSEKPDEVYDLIEAYFPNLPKIELNARQARAGWDSWGNEAPADHPVDVNKVIPPDTSETIITDRSAPVAEGPATAEPAAGEGSAIPSVTDILIDEIDPVRPERIESSPRADATRNRGGDDEVLDLRAATQSETGTGDGGPAATAAPPVPDRFADLEIPDFLRRVPAEVK